MRSISRYLLLAPALLCASAAFAAHITAVNVPFSFVAKGHTYSAGQYNVQLGADQRTVTLTNVQHPSQSFLWGVNPGSGDVKDPKVGLDFDITGSMQTLHKIRYGSLSTANLDSAKKRAEGKVNDQSPAHSGL